MSKDKTLPVAFQEINFHKRKDIFASTVEESRESFKNTSICCRSAQGTWTGQGCPEQQKWAEGQVCAWTWSDSCLLGAHTAPLQLRVNMQHLKALHSENGIITITQGEYCHYLTVGLGWLWVCAQDSSSGDFMRALFHSNLHPTGTVMVNS